MTVSVAALSTGVAVAPIAVLDSTEDPEGRTAAPALRSRRFFGRLGRSAGPAHADRRHVPHIAPVRPNARSAPRRWRQRGLLRAARDPGFATRSSGRGRVLTRLLRPP
jgi:hypothetical protein